VINKFTKEESSAENAAERAEKDGGSISKRWLAFNRHRKPTKKNNNKGLKQSKQHHCNLFIRRGCLRLIFNIFLIWFL
jgi:hypothetical protein